MQRSSEFGWHDSSYPFSEGQEVIVWCLECRVQAEPYAELRRAAAEQMKITELRLANLFSAAQQSAATLAQEGGSSTVAAAQVSAERRAGRIHAHLTQASSVRSAAAAPQGGDMHSSYIAAVADVNFSPPGYIEGTL